MSTSTLNSNGLIVESKFKIWPPQFDLTGAIADSSSIPNRESEYEEARAWFLSNDCDESSISRFISSSDNKTIAFRALCNEWRQVKIETFPDIEKAQLFVSKNVCLSHSKEGVIRNLKRAIRTSENIPRYFVEYLVLEPTA